MRCGKEDD